MNKRSILLAISIFGIIFTSTQIYAQNIGINTAGTAPDDAAILDVAASDKGLLIPRVSLTGTGDIATIAGSEEESLLIYNLATISDVTPGYYYWDGTNKWIALLSEDTDSTNEYNTALAVVSDSLKLTDGGGTLTVSLSGIGAGGDCALTEITDELSGPPTGGAPVAIGSDKTLADCLSACNSLVYNGNSDWRTPTMEEALILFPIAPNVTIITDYMWTTSKQTTVDTSTDYIKINLSSLGYIKQAAATASNSKCRCVR